MPPDAASGRRRVWQSVLVVLILASIALLIPVASLRGRSTPLDATTSTPVVPVSADGAGTGGALTSHGDHDAQAASPVAPFLSRTTARVTEAIRVTAATRFYDVEGGDVRSLLASLRQRGPADEHGSWAASTGWVFRWSYQPVVAAGCQVERAGVTLDLTYTYPRWTPPSGATGTLMAAWQGYLGQVERHEHGHRDIAQRAANDLIQALEALPPQARCEDLAVSAHTAADGLLARHARDQVTYDRETGHGATQGAVLSE